MSYFLSGLSKLKEQATSFHSITKNFIAADQQIQHENYEEELDGNNSVNPQAKIESTIATNSVGGVNGDIQKSQNEDEFFQKAHQQSLRNTQAKSALQVNPGLPPKSNSDQRKSENHIQRSQTHKRSFDIQELEDRINAYQELLRDNEITLDKYRARVIELEQKMQLTQSTPQQVPVQDQSKVKLELQVQTLLEALDSERKARVELEKEIKLLEMKYQEVEDNNYLINNEYSGKVKEIEQLLLNLQQSQNIPPTNSKQGGGGNKKNNKQQSQNSTVSTIDPKVFKDAIDQVIQLLQQKPQSEVPSSQQNQKVIDQLEKNNTFLKEVNIKIGDKIASLEQTYNAKVKENNEQLTLKEKELERRYDAKLQELIKEYSEKAKLQESQLSAKSKLLEDQSQIKLKQQEEQAQLKLKQQEEQAQIKMKQQEEQFLSKSQQQKKENLDSLVKNLQSSLTSQLEIDNKLTTSDSIEQVIQSFTSLVKDNFKGNQQVDQQLIQSMRDMWDQVCERFKTFNISKHQKQSQKDAQQWLSQRFTVPKLAKPSKQDFKDTEHFKFFDYQLQTLFSVNSLIQEQVQSVADANQKKDAMGQQLSKIQKEMKDIQSKEKEASKIKEQLDMAMNDKNSLKQQMQEVLQDKIQFKLKVEEQKEKLDMVIIENQNLKEKVNEIELDNKGMRKQIKNLQGQKELQENYKEQFERLQQDYSFMENQVNSKEAEQEEQRRTLVSLQKSLERQQEEYDCFQKSKDKELSDERKKYHELNQEYQRINERAQINEQIEQELAKTKQALEEVREKLQKNEIETDEVKKKAQLLLEKVKMNNESHDFMIDRRMINKFLINYLKQSSSKETKMHMLEAMSKILLFTDEEKQILGITIKQSAQSNGDPSHQKSQSIGDKLINYFLQDDDELM